MVTGMIVAFFFFQAEDGIRDDLVTGVQTCALPICLGEGESLDAVIMRKGKKETIKGLSLPEARQPVRRGSGRIRSEERRGGKECSTWRAPGIEKRQDIEGAR